MTPAMEHFDFEVGPAVATKMLLAYNRTLEAFF
jgi:hypothetical protein